ncbi:MAG: recombinase family protein, partial [Azospirillaceae bacterium]
SFVSVTQAFNTTTSMGRLTLNMLLSFAQFEREVTGERIRDKIAASKRKGMWMGGTVPLGYEPEGRTLAINAAEAETVRTIFRLYLEHGTVRRVKEESDRLRILTKRRRHPDGRQSGGRPMSRGYLYKLLGNPLYIGRIPHKGASYEGQHKPIIDQETWDAVQAGLKGNSHERSSAPRLTEPSPLIGKLFDADGHPLTPSHAVKNGRRYRYYVSRHLITGEAPTDAPAERAGWRLPAREIERIVSSAVDQLLTDRSELAGAARAAGWSVDNIPSLLDKLSALTDTAINYVDQVILGSVAVQITLSLREETGQKGPPIETTVPVTIRRRGVEQRLVLHGVHRSNVAGHTDPALVKALHRAHRWFEDLASGRADSLKAIAAREGVSDRYIGHLLPLAFLSPDLSAAILAGEQPSDLTLERLIHNIDIPLEWDDQHAQLGMS